MPGVDRVAAIQLGLLLLAVPTQYFISRYWSSTTDQRSYAIRKILNSAVGFKDNYLSLDKWQIWCLRFIDRVRSGDEFSESEDLEGESPAVEVMKYRDPKGYFAGSPEPRSPRPPHVKYRVGQVIKHKVWGYRGVIVGWDTHTKAPENWVKEMHPPDKKHWRTEPNYLVLVDERDRPAPQSTYVPEENIEIISNVKIIHIALENYFEGYDGAQYLPRPHLRTLYPHD